MQYIENLDQMDIDNPAVAQQINRVLDSLLEEFQNALSCQEEAAKEQLKNPFFSLTNFQFKLKRAEWDTYSDHPYSRGPLKVKRLNFSQFIPRNARGASFILLLHDFSPVFVRMVKNISSGEWKFATTTRAKHLLFTPALRYSPDRDPLSFHNETVSLTFMSEFTFFCTKNGDISLCVKERAIQQLPELYVSFNQIKVHT